MARLLPRARMLAAFPVLLVAAAFPVGGDSPVAAEAQDATLFERAMEFRAKAGLPAGADYVTGSLTDDRFSSEQWGVPLSPEELAELDRRLRIRKAIAPAFALARSLPESSGVYIDQQGGGVPVFLSTAEPAEFTSRIAPAIEPGLPFRVERVELAMSDLIPLKERVVADLAHLNDDLSVGVVSVGVYPQSNAVSIGLARKTEELSAQLHRLYGSDLFIWEAGELQGGDGSCLSGTNRKTCWPLMAGLKVWPDGHEPQACTSGMIVRNSTYHW